MGGTGPSVSDHMLNQALNLQSLSSSTQMSASVQFSCSVVTSQTATRQASLSITNSRCLRKVMVVEVSDVIEPSHPLLSLSPPTFDFSQLQGLLQ